MKSIEKSIKILLFAAALILLYLSSTVNYLLFHSIAEIFSICIALTVFFVTWNCLQFVKNNYLILVGTAYLFIGVLDFFHTLSYKGMMIFTDYDYYANQLWIAARYFESLVLLISFSFLKRKKQIPAFPIFILFTVVTASILLSVFTWNIFPVCFVEGVGLTPFKIISEYIICAILLAAIFVMQRQRKAFDKTVYGYLIASIVLTILSEVSFTTYLNNYGFTNLLGHYFKIISFYFIYRSIIHTAIKEPYSLIFREMKQTEELLSNQNTHLASKAATHELTIKENVRLLQLQNKILNRQARLLDLSHEAIFAWDFNSTIFYWNKGAESTYGYTPSEAVGKNSSELLKTKNPDSWIDIKDVLQRDGFWVGELIHTTKDNRIIHVETVHQLYTDEDGRRIVLEISHDITERKKLEESIRDQNELLNAIIEDMHDALFVYDRTGRIKFINAQARIAYVNHFNDSTTVYDAYSGYKCLDLQRNPIPFENYPTRRAFRGELIQNERVIIETDSWSRFVEINATPIFNSAHEITALVVSHHDVTEMISKQQAIEENYIQLQNQNKLLNRQAMLLDLSNEAILAWYLDGPIIYWNRGAEIMYGYKNDDAIGCLPQKLLNSHFPISYDELKAELLEKGAWNGMIEHHTKDGRHLIVETRMQIIINDIGLNTVLETNRDVTETIEAENTIRKTTIELKNIINSTQDFIWSVDANYNVLFCNNAVTDFVKKHSGIDVMPGIHFTQIMPGRPASVFLDLFERTKEEGAVHIDLSSLHGDRIVSYSLHPIYFDSELIEITIFGRDITGRLRAEQEIIKLNTSLETKIAERTKELQQSLETIKNFSMTVTHDLKMPLYEIQKNAKNILEQIDIKANASRITELCASMNRMIAELLDYERISGSVVRKEQVDMAHMIRSVFEEYKTDNAVLKFQTGIPHVVADKVLIRHVIENLLSNALKFSSKRSLPTITVGCRKDKDHYVFYIKDNGAGFDMAYADRLFKIFERLHHEADFAGHGIGLASVKNIIEKHGGRTWIDSIINAGTTVYFSLPADVEGGKLNV